MRRRTFLAAAATTTALAALKVGTLHAQQPESADVLVVGAGAAGLAAASALQAEGLRVVVLEARERIGGRVWSDQSWAQGTADLGASWIHGRRGNPLTALARDAGVRTVPFDYDAYAAFQPDAVAVDERALTSAGRSLERQLEAVAAFGEEQETDLSLRAALDAASSEVGAPRDPALLEFLLNTSVEHEFGADVEQLSAWYYDSAWAPAGGDLLLPSGYIGLFEPVAAGLDIRLASPVSAMRHTRRGIAADTASGPIAARAAVLTVPLALLQRESIRLTPALPRSHRAAVGRLGMGLLNKCFLSFDAPFWADKTEAQLLGHVGAQRGLWAEWVNFAAVNGLPILLGFNAGSSAEALEALDDAATVESAMAALREMFGPSVPQPISARVTRWRSDPWAGGSYSHFAVGASPEDCAKLATPAGPRLVLAGEHTHPEHPSTVHGAWLSGLRAAAQVAAMLAG